MKKTILFSFLFVFSLALVSSQSDLHNGLIHHWAMSDYSDSVEGGIDLQDGTGPPSFVDEGIINRAVRISPSGNLQTILPNINLNPRNPDWTLNFWVKANSFNERYLFYNTIDGAYYYIDPSGLIQTAGVYLGDPLINTHIELSQWTMITISNGGNYANIYQDGDYIATYNLNSPIGSNQLLFGWRPERPADDFDGLMDEVSIWSRELTADEILELYNNGSGIDLFGVDGDGDGYFSSEDCDDTNPNINPNATEICDGIDNDCDGYVDEFLLCDEYLNQRVSVLESWRITIDEWKDVITTTISDISSDVTELFTKAEEHESRIGTLENQTSANYWRYLDGEIRKDIVCNIAKENNSTVTVDELGYECSLIYRRNGLSCSCSELS